MTNSIASGELLPSNVAPTMMITFYPTNNNLN